MNILFCHRPGGAFGYITDSMINALRNKGHKVQRWDGNEQTWIDFKPDIYCGASGHKQPIPPKRNCKIALHANPYGPVTIQGINENENDIKWVLNQKPDVVFGYGTEEDRILWSHWTVKHNIIWVPMPTAGDKILYKKLINDDQKEYDLVYLGGYWTYKGKSIDSFLLPPLTNKQLKSKVYGWGDWPNNLSDGSLSEDKVTMFLNSGKIGPCIAEPHTHSHGIDIPERAFKVALCGTLVIHDAIPSLKTLMPSAIICNNPEQFHNMCFHYSQPENNAERIEIIEKQRQEVLNGQTYHHRMGALFNALGFVDEAKHMIE